MARPSNVVTIDHNWTVNDILLHIAEHNSVKMPYYDHFIAELREAAAEDGVSLLVTRVPGTHDVYVSVKSREAVRKYFKKHYSKPEVREKRKEYSKSYYQALKAHKLSATSAS